MGTGSAIPIRKAVIPVAGLGTRQLPFTKAVPKEMLPVGNKPLIQYAVEEAVASGIEEIILIVSHGKSIIQEHFSRNLSLEEVLHRRGRHADAEAIRWLSQCVRISTACQEQQLGLGHAVSCARDLVGDEAFAVILPDALVLGQRPCLRQLIDCYERYPACFVATREVAVEDLSRYGVLKVAPVADTQLDGRLFRVEGLVEKPKPEIAPSRFGIFGRYIFQPAIFDHIERVVPDGSGEIQITDAMAKYCRDLPLYAFCFEGEHYDVGSKLGYLQASVMVGLSDPDTQGAFRRFIDGASGRC